MSPVVGIAVAQPSFDLANGKHRTKAKLPNEPKGFQALHAWLLAHAPAWIAQIERAIDDPIDQAPALRGQRELLVSIDGIADTSAASMLAERGNVERFAHAAAAPPSPD